AEINRATFRSEVSAHFGGGRDGACIAGSDFLGDPVVFDGGSGLEDDLVVVFGGSGTLSIIDFERNSDDCIFFGAAGRL
ncbi:MAG: hypothetical protein ABFS02_10890, partial [Pseudomonadota bacterium]